MSPVRATWRRTLGAVRNLYSTVLAVAGFFAAAGALFAFNFAAAEGTGVSLAAVWTVSVSPVLPFLAALVGMDVWSDERRSGRIEILLSSPVRERDFVIGKFLGVWTVLLGAVVVFHLSTLAFLVFFAPRLLAGMPLAGFVPGFLALALQGALWSASAVTASAAFRHSAAAAAVALTLTAALPRGLWAALAAWSREGRAAFGEMPLDAHAFDMASGLVSTGTVLGYLLFTGVALFVATKLVASVRLVGRGARGLLGSTFAAILLSLVFAGSALALVERLDLTIDLPFFGPGETRFSARTRNILAEMRGRIAVTAFLSRSDAKFRPLAHFLRALDREADAMGGSGVVIRYVDPDWDVSEAARLVRAGAERDSIVFERERGGRLASVPLSEGYGERACASAILKVAMPPQRRSVCWTSGHGELSFEAYGKLGMSDISRDLARDGYRNVRLDLAGEAQIPGDCALIVVAGAKDDFSRVESARLDAYLRQGGRLLVLLDSAESGGVVPVLASWGLRPKAATFSPVRTLTGTEVLVGDFSDHPVSRPLQGSQIVLDRPVALFPSAAVEDVAGADRIAFSELASVGGTAVAAVAERGAGTGDDVAIRPTRVIAVGDAGFVMNGQLDARANANRDFFLNCIAYLAGTDALTSSGTEADRLVSGMDDRVSRVRFLLLSAVGFPAAAFIVGLVLVARRRRRE